MGRTTVFYWVADGCQREAGFGHYGRGLWVVMGNRSAVLLPQRR